VAMRGVRVAQARVPSATQGGAHNGRIRGWQKESQKRTSRDNGPVTNGSMTPRFEAISQPNCAKKRGHILTMNIVFDGSVSRVKYTAPWRGHQEFISRAPGIM
jgi:hypothetical protein